MSIEAARKNFDVAKKSVAETRKLLDDLVKRHDDLETSIPNLKAEFEELEKREASAYDDLVMNKIGEKQLERIKAECNTAKNKHHDSSRLLESLGRAIEKTKNELSKLNAELQHAERATWQSIGDELLRSVPDEIFQKFTEIIVAQFQIGRGYEFVLETLFKRPSTDEISETQKSLRKRYGI